MMIRLIALLCLSLWLNACENPFQTREPEPPRTAGDRWLPPFSADLVLVNLENAVADLNTENYVRCFSDGTRGNAALHFEPDLASTNTNPGFFAFWSLADERFYFSQLRASMSGDSLRSLQLDSLQTIVFGDSAIFLRAYDLTVRHTLQSSGVPGRVRGELRFWLNKDELGEWSITRWADFASGSTQTWSSLKILFGSR